MRGHGTIGQFRPAHAAAAEADEFFRAEVEAFYADPAVGLALLGTDLRYLRVNECLAELNGVPAPPTSAAPRPRSCRDWPIRIEAACRQVFETGQATHGPALCPAKPPPAGPVAILFASFRPVKHAGGRLLGALVILTEVTAQRRAEQAQR